MAECTLSCGKQLDSAFLLDRNQSEIDVVLAACPNASKRNELRQFTETIVVESRLEQVVLHT